MYIISRHYFSLDPAFTPENKGIPLSPLTAHPSSQTTSNDCPIVPCRAHISCLHFGYVPATTLSESEEDYGPSQGRRVLARLLFLFESYRARLYVRNNPDTLLLVVHPLQP